MSKPFNFLQTSYTGEVSAYSGRFEEFFTPSGMRNAPDAFHWRLDHEVYEQKPSLVIGLSGDVVGSKTDPFVGNQIVFSGSFFGVKSGFSDNTIRFSGRITGNPNEINNLMASFSGQQNGSLQSNDLLTRVSGRAERFPTDYNSLIVTISGDFQRDNLDRQDLSSRISGNFINSQRDLVSLNVGFENLSFESYRPKIRTVLSPDTAQVDVSLFKIIWSRAGG